MDNDITTLFNETIASFRQTLLTCHHSLENLFNKSFSVADLQNYKAVQLGIFHMNRICSTAEYLISAQEAKSKQALKSYDINNLLETMVSSFYSTVSGYFPATVNCYTKLRSSSSIQTDERKFELIVLHILYCCLKNTIGDRFAPVKITIYATEIKNFIVFHIRDSSNPLNSAIVSNVFKDTPNVSNCSSEISFNAIITQSLTVAKKTAKDLCGKLSYTALKSGNRFDVYLPKHKHTTPKVLRSPISYIPNIDVYNEIFAEIKLEHTLAKLDNALSAEGILL